MAEDSRDLFLSKREEEGKEILGPTQNETSCANETMRMTHAQVSKVLILRKRLIRHLFGSPATAQFSSVGVCMHVCMYACHIYVGHACQSEVRVISLRSLLRLWRVTSDKMSASTRSLRAGAKAWCHIQRYSCQFGLDWRFTHNTMTNRLVIVASSMSNELFRRCSARGAPFVELFAIASPTAWAKAANCLASTAENTYKLVCTEVTLVHPCISEEGTQTVFVTRTSRFSRLRWMIASLLTSILIQRSSYGTQQATF